MTAPPRQPRRRPAFTLVELTAVLVLAALLAAAVAASLAGTRRGAGLDDAVGQWRAFDAAARTVARRSGQPLVLRVDLDAGRAQRMMGSAGPSDDADASRGGAVLTLPSGPDGVRVEQVLVLADARPGGEPDRWSGGRVDLTVSARGYTPTYAVRLAGAAGRHRWLLFAGLTGEPTEMADDAPVLQTLRPPGPSDRDPSATDGLAR